MVSTLVICNTTLLQKVIFFGVFFFFFFFFFAFSCSFLKFVKTKTLQNCSTYFVCHFCVCLVVKLAPGQAADLTALMETTVSKPEDLRRFLENQSFDFIPRDSAVISDQDGKWSHQF